MALTMEVIVGRVREAMEAAGMSQRELGQAIGMETSAVSKVLSGKRGFKAIELALIAEALGVPLDDFVADEQTRMPRASVLALVQPDASPAAGRALARAQRMLDLDELLIRQGFEGRAMVRPQPAPAGHQPREQGEFLAERLRAQCGLGAADLPTDVSQLASEVEDKFGVDVAIEPLDDGLDGLAVSRPGYALMIVSSSIPAHRQRYAIAHELGHLMAGDQGAVLDEDINYSATPAETRANAFAAAFLMPAVAVRSALGQSAPTEGMVADLLGRYRVSLDALAVRLHGLGIVSAAGRDAVRRMSSVPIALRAGRATDLQARHEQRWPGGLLRRAVEAYAWGKISIRPVARLINVDPDALLDELAPPEPELLRTGPVTGDPEEEIVPRL